MTSYDIADDNRIPRRVDTVIKEYKLLPVSKPSDESILHPPISVDGKFRSLITINGRMPGPTIIAQTLRITVHNKLPNAE